MREVPSPPLVPGFDIEVVIVLDDFGRAGRAYRETDEDQASREIVIRDLLTGQYERPVRIIAFNTAQGWSRDISDEVAKELEQRARESGDRLPFGTKAFVEYQLGIDA